MMTSNEFAILRHKLKIIACLAREVSPELDDFLLVIPQWEPAARTPTVRQIAQSLKEVAPSLAEAVNALEELERDKRKLRSVR